VVSRYRIEGMDTYAWRTLSRGTTIGYAKIDRLEPPSFHRIRVTIEDAVAQPVPIRIRVYPDPAAGDGLVSPAVSLPE
jgi:alpha-L-fucosidase